MSHTRDIQSNGLCSSLITWVSVIGSGDKMACSRVVVVFNVISRTALTRNSVSRRVCR